MAQQVGDPFQLSQTGSCPTFHCDAEGTSLMQHAMPMPVSGTSMAATNQLTSDAADVPGAIGCTSDDSNFVCLFQSGSDAVISFAVGAQGQTQLTRNFTLARNTNIAQPWAEQFAPIEGQNANRAPVPVIGADHSVIIADSSWVKRLTQSGVQVWPTTETPLGTGDVGLQLGYQNGTKHNRNVLGVTPVQWGDETAVAVTFNDGASAASRSLSNVVVFRASDGSFIAKYPSTTTDSSTQGFQITDDGGVVHSFQSISPPTSHGSSLYFVGYESGTNLGVLARFDLSGDSSDPIASALTLISYVTFGGAPGASPVFADNARFTNFPYSELVLHVPDPTQGTLAQLGCDFASGGVPVTGDHLVSFSPDLSGCNWASALDTSGNSGVSAPLLVAPVVDPVNAGFWAWTSYGTGQQTGGATLFHYPAGGGVFDRTINIVQSCQAAKVTCGSGPEFVGHLQAINPPGTNTVYLATFTGAQLGTGSPKNVIAFDTTPGLKAAAIIKWLAPVSDLSGYNSGGALPLVSFSNGAPGLVFASSSGTTSPGNVSLIQP